MNAAELVSAIRAEHESYEGFRCLVCDDECGPGRWPCPSSIAADRIEALLNLPGDTLAPNGPKALVDSILNGES